MAGADAGASAALAAVALPESAQAVDTFMLPVNSLSTFQRSDQRAEMFNSANAELSKVLTKEDAPKTMRHASLVSWPRCDSSRCPPACYDLSCCCSLFTQHQRRAAQLTRCTNHTL